MIRDESRYYYVEQSLQWKIYTIPNNYFQIKNDYDSHTIEDQKFANLRIMLGD